MRASLIIATLAAASVACTQQKPVPIPAPTSVPEPAPAAAAPATTVSMPAAADPDKVVAGGGISAAGWMGRVDPQAAKAGRTINEAKFVTMGDGFHVTAGPAAIYWNAANTATGNYTATATFSQTKASAHPEGYGLLIAGHNLDQPTESYLYFLVRQDGKFLINHRADDNTVHKMVDWTANPAVHAIDASGKATNALSVVVGSGAVSFRVNGTEVHSIPRATLDSGGDHSGTTGIVGLRVNHNLDVHVSDFGVKAG
ncbi:MAG TPA: hypothetical protein VIF83_08820 [Gemmatimonadaceae bacterium]